MVIPITVRSIAEYLDQMALAINDIIEIRMDGVALGEETTNVFYFQSGSISTAADYLEDAVAQFITEVVARITPVLANTTAFNHFVAKNLTNGLDFYEESNNLPGAIASPALPSQTTFTVKLTRSSLLTRNGSKRYSGLSEAGVTGNLINWVPAQKAALEDAHAEVLSYASTPGTVDLGPVIVGRTFDPIEGEYVLDLDKINPIASAVAGFYTSSQVSRKAKQQYTSA